MFQGLVLWAIGNRARILVSGREYMVDIPGRWRLDLHGARPLVPGDYVSLKLEGDLWRMIDLLPRTNEFTRRTPGMKKDQPQVIAANIDRALIVAAAAEPPTPTGLVDRLLVTAELGGITPAIVINKIDLISPDQLTFWEKTYRYAGELFFTSALTGEGISRIVELIADRTILLAGKSGVGKSSIINRIDPTLDLKTARISKATGKGRHITSATELHWIEIGGWVADTPGLRECAPWGMTPENLTDAFPEIRRLADRCKFRDCRHFKEKGCAVREAVGSPELPVSRYKSYLKLLAEVQANRTSRHR